MFIKIIMDSGKEYTIEKHYEDFIEKVTQGPGIIKNTLITIDVDKGIILNPNHISSIEIIREEVKVQKNF